MKKATSTIAIAALVFALCSTCAYAAPSLEEQTHQADKKLAEAETALQKAEYAFGQADAQLDYEQNNGADDKPLITKAASKRSRAKAIMELRQAELAEARRLDGELHHALGH
jgi:peptidoglycan hydrolase CwlO-like protein